MIVRHRLYMQEVETDSTYLHITVVAGWSGCGDAIRGIVCRTFVDTYPQVGYPVWGIDMPTKILHMFCK